MRSGGKQRMVRCQAVDVGLELEQGQGIIRWEPAGVDTTQREGGQRRTQRVEEFLTSYSHFLAWSHGSPSK